MPYCIKSIIFLKYSYFIFKSVTIFDYLNTNYSNQGYIKTNPHKIINYFKLFI